MPVTRSVWRIVEETTPLVIGFAVLELIAGGILGTMIIDIELLPGLFILIPALLDMRWGIGCTLGARLNSGLLIDICMVSILFIRNRVYYLHTFLPYLNNSRGLVRCNTHLFGDIHLKLQLRKRSRSG